MGDNRSVFACFSRHPVENMTNLSSRRWLPSGRPRYYFRNRGTEHSGPADKRAPLV